MPRASSGALVDSVEVATAWLPFGRAEALRDTAGGAVGGGPNAKGPRVPHGLYKGRLTRRSESYPMLDPNDRVVSVRIWSKPALCRLEGDSRLGARRCGSGVRTYQAHRSGDPAGEPAPTRRCRPGPSGDLVHLHLAAASCEQVAGGRKDRVVAASGIGAHETVGGGHDVRAIETVEALEDSRGSRSTKVRPSTVAAG